MNKDLTFGFVKQIQAAAASDAQFLKNLESFWSKYQKGKDEQQRKQSGKNLPNIEAFTELLDEIHAQKSDDTDGSNGATTDSIKQFDLLLVDIPNNNDLLITYNNNGVGAPPNVSFKTEKSRVRQTQLSNTLVIMINLNVY